MTKEQRGRGLTLEEANREAAARMAPFLRDLPKRRMPKRKDANRSWADAAAKLLRCAVSADYSVEERLKAIESLQRHLSGIEKRYRDHLQQRVDDPIRRAVCQRVYPTGILDDPLTPDHTAAIPSLG